MEQIFLSILVFTGLVLILVSILNFAESKLLPQGDIRINTVSYTHLTLPTTSRV